LAARGKHTHTLRADREIVLAAVRQNGYALTYATEALKGDREIVLTAVQKDGVALKYATEALKSDRDVVLTAVQQDGDALEHATEALRADPEVVEAAMQKSEGPLRFAADCLLEDANFAIAAAKRHPFGCHHLLKLTMVSGRSTVVVANHGDRVGSVLAACRRRLGLPDDGARMELLHGLESVPDGVMVRDWPGIQPRGKISEYQLVLTR